MSEGYSAIDRFLHRIALDNPELQLSLADMENRIHAPRLKSIGVARPVFVTSLPRAGTTFLLEALCRTGAFASQTYRDMPFVLCPLLWNAISRGFQSRTDKRERAHGDGMLVGFDSPEAFEEVLWKAFWAEKYQKTEIRLWGAADRNAEFEEAFENQMRKVVALRSQGAPLRYVSKNNANIARLPLLTTLFPDCTILIPFRNPVDHASSLLRQHRNFLALHARDRFAQRYMEWIGHYEFGNAFRPIAFEGAGAGDPETLDYWLHYWDRAFRHILQNAPAQVTFVDFDALCANPQQQLERIARAAGLPQDAFQSESLAPAVHYEQSGDSELLARAGTTHEALKARSC